MEVSDMIHSDKYLSKEYTRRLKKKTRKTSTQIETDANEKKYLKIWKLNPSFRDINSRQSMTKLLWIVGLSGGSILSLFVITANISLSVAGGLGIGVVFIGVFHDHFSNLQGIFAFSTYQRFDPFEQMVFWCDDEDTSTLIISHRKELTHIATRIYKITVMPENIRPTITRFLKALSGKDLKMSYCYQVVQSPKPNSAVQTTVYFSVIYEMKGILTPKKREYLNYKINLISVHLKSNFVANFHHFNATQLAGDQLINAFRTLFLQVETDSEEVEPQLRPQIPLLLYGKIVVLSSIFIYLHWLLTFLGLVIWYILVFDLIIIVGSWYLWVKEIFFVFSKKYLQSADSIKIVRPFDNVLFYRSKQLPDTLFLYVNRNLLIGLQMLNLKYVIPPPFCDITNFYQAIIQQKLHHAYTIFNQPLDGDDFYKNGFDSLKLETQKQLKRNGYSEQLMENWMNMRSGMWNSTLTIAVTSYQAVDDLHFEDLVSTADNLSTKTHVMKGIFDMNFSNFELVALKGNTLLSGFLFTCLKQNLFRHQGTHLNYVMLQGHTLAPLSTVSDALKKGVETRIAAEFNTPLHLENDIVIGHTINTEVLEKEVAVGFTHAQVKNLLISGGAFQNRQLIMMRVVAELIKTGKPSLIFDFQGNWSKLISHFKGTPYETSIEHFKAGTVFNLDLTHSDLAYDTDNISYIDYMADALSIALKKDEHTIAMFRDTLSRNQGMDLQSLNVELQTQNNWERNRATESVLSLLSEFTQQDMAFFQRAESTYDHKVFSYEFIKTPKTVIIDLSLSNKIPTQLFVTFLILSKIIHYLRSSEEFTKKVIIIPYLDLFFDARYLDTRRNFGLINRFFDPLIRKGFGFSLSANQIHYLHPNVFTYFNNLVALKTTDNRDIAVLSRVMNLQELEGRGYYSRSRNQTYQIRYLETMNSNEILIKREDQYQPFPAIIDWEEIKKRKILSYDQIIKYMEGQGYNLKHAEKSIIEQAKRTLFEKDLGAYFSYLDEVISFLKQLKQIDHIGNLYKSKVKDQLRDIIYPKASIKTKKKEHIKKIRDELFAILIRQGYLVEAHPSKASGSESLRTSYRVGEQFEKASDDYFKIKSSQPSEISFEMLEAESNLPVTRNYVVKKGDIRKALARELSDFNFELFSVYSYLNRKDYKNALKIEYNLIRKFLVNVYHQFYNVNYGVTSKDLKNFAEHLGSIPNFPFTKDKLLEYIDKFKIIRFDWDNMESMESKSTEVYQDIYNFFIEIQKFMYHESENHE
jgi:hypothetical protein